MALTTNSEGTSTTMKIAETASPETFSTEMTQQTVSHETHTTMVEGTVSELTHPATTGSVSGSSKDQTSESTVNSTVTNSNQQSTKFPADSNSVDISRYYCLSRQGIGSTFIFLRP